MKSLWVFVRLRSFCWLLSVVLAVQKIPHTAGLPSTGVGSEIGEERTAEDGDASRGEYLAVREDYGGEWIQEGEEFSDDYDDEDDGRIHLEDYDEDEAMFLLEANRTSIDPSLLSTRARLICVPGAQFILRSHNLFGIMKYPNNHVMKMTFIKPTDTLAIELQCPFFKIELSPRCSADRFTVLTGPKFRRGIRRCGQFRGLGVTYFRSIKTTFRTNGANRRAGFHCEILCIPNIAAASVAYSPNCLVKPEPAETPNPVTTCSDILPNFLNTCSCDACPSSGRLSLICTICSGCDMEIFAAHQFSVPLAVTFLFNDSCSDTVDMGDLTYGNEDQFQVLRLCYPVPERVIIPVWPSVVSVFYTTGCPTAMVGDPCMDAPARVRGGISRLLKGQRTFEKQEKSSEPADLSVLESFPNLETLCLNEIPLDTRSIPAMAHLQSLMISDESGIMPNQVFDLTSLDHLREIFVVLGNAELLTNSIEVGSSQVEYIHIEATKTNVELVEPDFLNLTVTPTHTPEVMMVVNPERMPFVLFPVFKPILKDVIVHWLNEDGTCVECQHCGVAWFWKLTPAELERLQVECLGPDGTVWMAADFIHAGGQNPCSMYFG